jgi:hypothetical protein
MMETIATQVIREVDWKMLLEAAGNTAVSFFDLFTDFYMIYFYFTHDQAAYAIATIGMILMSLFMQCFTIFFLYMGDKKAMKRELFYTLTYVKGGRLQLNVLKGNSTQGCALEAAVVRCISLSLSSLSLPSFPFFFLFFFLTDVPFYLPPFLS